MPGDSLVSTLSKSSGAQRKDSPIGCLTWLGTILQVGLRWGFRHGLGLLFGGASSAVRAQCNYLGVWPY